VVKAVQTGSKFRIVMAICPGKSESSRLPSVALEDGSIAFEVTGNGVRELVVLQGDGVRVLPATGASPGAVQTAPRPADQEADAGKTREFEEANAHARAALRDSSGAQEALDRMNARIAAGFDYGAAATIRDLEGLVPDGSRSPLDARTRVALYGNDLQPAMPALKGAPVHHYWHADEAPRVRSPRSVHVFETAGLAMPMLLQRGEGDTLVVTLHGALNRARTVLPRFERVRSISELGLNVLAIGDPTLDLDPSLTLGWYLGSREVDLHARIAEVVSSFSDALSIRKVIVLGSSGGGFAALHLAALLPEATVLVMNPQTDVRRYHSAFSRRALRSIFGADAALGESALRRISVLERFATTTNPGRVRYIVNSGDLHHVKEHAEPFWESIADRPVDLETTWLDLGPGHVSPDLATVRRLLEEEVRR
jgi:pimeloyl-ACP methyl ester carboxylesterase